MKLSEGEVLESDRGVILLGSVDPGGLIVSGGDIIVCGTLAGEAVAGAARYIAAFELIPSHLRIGQTDYFPDPEDKPRWFVKPKMEPKCAREAEGKIIIGPLDRSFVY